MEEIQKINTLNLEDAPRGEISRYWLHIVSDGIGQPLYIPIIIAKGMVDGPVLGLVAAIHGNEINGIPVIQKIFQNIDVGKLRGTIVGVPVLNIPGFLNCERRFNDKVDLNHKMPGRKGGNRSDIYAYRIMERIVKNFQYLVDLHTASFGRVNSYYVRADMENPTTKKMAELQNADIILNTKGAEGTLRRSASALGIASITLELRDPHLFQKDVIHESYVGIINLMNHLQMLPGEIVLAENPPVICESSYWIYTEHGGILNTLPQLGEIVEEGKKIALVRNIFGDIIAEYTAPEKGIVIGKGVNPVNQTGSRIIHLGVIKKEY